MDSEPPLRQAIAAVFALVTVADGEVVVSEVARFEQWLAERSREVAVRHQAMAEYHQMCGLLEDDYERGIREVKDRLAAVADNSLYCELLVSAARTAVVADHHIDEREEVALRDVFEILGLDPDEA